MSFLDKAKKKTEEEAKKAANKAKEKTIAKLNPPNLLNVMK